MNLLAQDLRFAFRQLRKSPGFSLTVILTLALGIGATTAIFSLVEGILLRPLPFANADRLVLLGDHLRNGPNVSVTAREISTYTTATSAFSSMGGFIDAAYELSGGAVPEQIYVSRLTSSVFPTLDVRTALGRVFTQQEEDAHQPLAVISYSLWLNRYGLDSKVLGRTIVLNRVAYTIIGVMPRTFEFPLQAGRAFQAQVWLPMSLTPDELSEEQTGYWGYRMVARLKDGVSLTQAAQDVDRVAQQVMRDFPANMSAIHIWGDVQSLRENLVRDVRNVLRTLLYAVAIVLLIACVNASGMLLVRAIRRRREYAVRLALGAGPGGIIRESVLEGVLLSLTGGLLGLAFAAIALRTALHLLPDSMPRIDSIFMDATVVTFALLAALATGVICSLAPAFAAMRTDLTESLKEGGRTGTGASSHAWLRSFMVVLEIGVALVLLTVSGAFLRSFQKMRAVDPGFRPDHVLVATYQLPVMQYPRQSNVGMFNRSVLDRLSHQPGIIAAGLANAIPASDVFAMAGHTVEGVPIDRWKLQFVAFAVTDGDYFRAVGIPLLEGRVFTEDDRSNSLLVVMVNEFMAKHYWPGQEAVGKRIHMGNPQKGLPWATVVGVVANTKLGARDEPDVDQIYIPAQQPAILFGTGASEKLSNPTGGFIILRSGLPPEQMIQTLRASVAEVDPLLALEQVQPMDDLISNVEAPRRFNTDLITTFALGALLLAITGIYAVVAFSVSQRTQEIAIRMALGAQRSGIAALVLIGGTKMGLAGCALGVLGSLAASRLVGSFLFEITATDPWIYASSVLLMMLMALLASLLPAIRAASADPVAALRAT